MLKYVEIPSGETLSYRVQGDGDKILLLIHGNMTSSKHFDVLMETLPEDIKVYAVDMRGFGNSTYNNRFDSLKDLSDDIKGFVDALKIEPFNILGWSTGGGVAMQYAIDYPEDIKTITLLESVGITGYPMFKKDSQGQPIDGEFLRTKEDIESDPVQVQPILNAYANKDKATLRAIWDAAIYVNEKPNATQYEAYLDDMLTQRNLVDIDYSLVHFNISHTHNGVVEGTGEVEKLTQPILMFQGSMDYVVPMDMAMTIKEGIASNLKYVEGPWGHSPLIDALDTLKENICAFIV